MAWRTWSEGLDSGYVEFNRPGKVTLVLNFTDGYTIVTTLDDPNRLVPLGEHVDFVGVGGPVIAQEELVDLEGGQLVGYTVDDDFLHLAWENQQAGLISLEAPLVDTPLPALSASRPWRKPPTVEASPIKLIGLVLAVGLGAYLLGRRTA